MGLLNRTIPALMNGISKQPAILRSPDQTEDELNTWGRIASGLSRRPPTQHVAKLTGLSLGNAHIHHINRDATERYEVLIDNDGIRVFETATGAEKTVNYPRGRSYLNAAPELVTNGSFNAGATTGWTATGATLSVVNGSMRVTNSGAAAGYAYQAITCVVGTDYTVTLGYAGNNNAGKLVSVAAAAGGLTFSGSGTSLTFTASATTMYVMVWAGTAVAADYNEYDNISVKLAAGVGEFRAVTVADYTFVVNTAVVPALIAVSADAVAQNTRNRWLGGAHPESIASQIARSINGQPAQYAPNTLGASVTGTVSKIEDLPATPASGSVYKVLGGQATSFVSYYVRWDGSAWNETVLPGLKNGIDEITVPHVLVREADGTFTFAPASWKPRRVGDQQTNPNPLFIGKTIRDVLFVQNRLAFLVDESIVFSVVGDYGDFWRRTILDFLESDGFSAAATTNDVAILDYAVPFVDGIMLFSKQRQLSLTWGDAGLGPSALSIQPVTTYFMADGVAPVPIGNLVDFATDANGAVSVQEYTRIADSDPMDAADITAHVPRLIPGGVSQLISAPDLDALVVLASGASDPTKAYVYQYFWDGDKKLQSAWRTWSFNGGIPHAASYQSGALTVLVERGGNIYIEKIDLEPEATSANVDHLIYLDRQVSVTGTYNAGTDQTTFAMPYAADATKVRIVRTKLATVPESLINTSGYTVGPTSIIVPGDESAHPVIIGEAYTSSVTLSQQFALDYQAKPLTTGRLQLHTFTVNHTDSVDFRAEVYPYGTDVLEFDPNLYASYPFTGRNLFTTGLILGRIHYDTGKFTFSVSGVSDKAVIKLIADSPYAATWVSAEWEGLYFNRALRT